MQTYTNITGRSAITAFESGDDFIKVKFDDGGIYVYTVESAGQIHVETMQKLAAKGSGLNAFINKYVKENYAVNVA